MRVRNLTKNEGVWYIVKGTNEEAIRGGYAVEPNGVEGDVHEKKNREKDGDLCAAYLNVGA